jgi:hypothetical protein
MMYGGMRSAARGVLVEVERLRDVIVFEAIAAHLQH